MLYLVVKWIHIIFAVTALGANLTYAVWFGLGARDPRHMEFVLRGVKFLDDWIATPAYVLLLVSGIVLVVVGGISPTTTWIVVSLILYAIAFLTGLFVAAPMMRRQLKLIDAGAAATPEYMDLGRKSSRLGTGLTFLSITITFVMVVKPFS